MFCVLTCVSAVSACYFDEYLVFLLLPCQMYSSFVVMKNMFLLALLFFCFLECFLK